MVNIRKIYIQIRIQIQNYAPALCLRRLKKKHLIILILMIIVFCTVIQYHRARLIGGISCPRKVFPFGHHAARRAPCQIIHVGTSCYTEADVHQTIVTIKSLVTHTHSAIELHIVTSIEGQRVLDLYFNTWELQHVKAHCYTSDSKLSALDYFLTDDIESKPKSMILLQTGAFFAADVKPLWLYTGSADTKLQIIQPILSLHQAQETSVQQIPAALLLRINTLRSRVYCNQSESFQQFEAPMKYAYGIKCRLNHFKSESVKQTALEEVYKYKAHRFDGIYVKHKDMSKNEEALYESVQSIDGYTLRDRSVNVACRYTFQKGVLPLESDVDNCYELRYAACAVYITHLYYYNLRSSAMFGPVRSDSEVTAVIQLQFNRFPSLHRILDRWQGPVHVVLYINQSESQLLLQKLRSDQGLTRDDVFYHVVYKQQLVYNPINMLRNIGIKEVRTEYLFVLDVDFIPNQSLYKRLLRVIRQQVGNPQKAYIVPVFEGLLTDYAVPDRKHELLHDMKQGRVIAYHQGVDQFSKGHEPTKYSTWMIAEEPYEVKYQPDFEPYLMLKTLDSPLFYEIQLERMGDKYTYVLEVHRKGFPLVVLDDVFMVHLPHPPSIAHQFANFHFQRCFRYYYSTIQLQLDTKYSVLSESVLSD